MTEEEKSEKRVDTINVDNYSICPQNVKIKDMDEGDFLNRLSPSLKIEIESINKEIIVQYDKSNNYSKLYQKKYKNVSLISLILILSAAGLAIIQVSKIIHSEIILWGEMVVVILALFFWIIERVKKYHELWLIERHKAERCRFLKFKQILDPDPYEIFTKNIAKISSITSNKEIKEWIITEGLPINDHSYNIPGRENDLCERIKYYFCVRLLYQKNFYDDRRQKNKRKDELIKFFEPVMFLVISFVTILHIILDTFMTSSVLENAFSGLTGIEIGFMAIFLAALLFIIDAGVKTIKVLFAYSQIFIMYNVTFNTLERSEKSLKKILTDCKDNITINKDHPKIYRILMDMYNCEKIMQHEHAIWFGILSDSE